MPKRKECRKGVSMPRLLVFKDLQRTSKNWTLISTHVRKEPDEERISKAKGRESRAACCDFDWAIILKSLVIRAAINLTKG